MFKYQKKSTSYQNATANENSKAYLPFPDTRPAAKAYKKIQEMANNFQKSHPITQLSKKGGGSHGKHLYFKVTTITIRNNHTQQNRYVNANHEEDLGVVPSHGQGPTKKNQADANAVAQNAVQLGANEQIIHVTFNHYTK